MQTFIDRFMAKATKARQAQSRVNTLAKKEIPEMPNAEHKIMLSFPKLHPSVDCKLLTLENVAVGYGEKVVLRNVELCVNMRDRIVLLRANGNEKSTFAKLLSNRLAPISGNVAYARNLKISYFSQQQTDGMNVENTSIEMLHSMVRDFSEIQIRSYLARFGIIQTRSETLIKHLSRGEKSRVLLATNLLFNFHAMILDEPKNHLAIKVRETLVEMINKYEGTMVRVIHDFFYSIQNL
jgi:ATP-binding cassette subfamily F protein 3